VRPPVLSLLVMAVAALLHTTLLAQEPDPRLERGTVLFARLCAACHGETGAGNGPVSSLLDPRPRDFGLATFHVVSTENRLPSDDDLLDTLRLGMVGTAMPGWSHLPEEDLRALVAFLRETMVRRQAENGLRRPTDRTPERRAAVERQVREELTPGARVPIGPAPPSTPERVARGHEVWVASCVECHGELGRGGERDDLKDIRGEPSRPRDMTRGLFRGSDEPVELARRIALGMPGTAMPSFDLPPEDLWAVVFYVRGLVKPGAQQEMLQIRRTLVAPRTKEPLHERAGIDWQFVPQVNLPLMPYVWDGCLVERLAVQVVQDGSRLAVRVRWDDPAADGARGQMSERSLPELNLKLSTEAEPPLVSAHGGGLRVWSWEASAADEDGHDGAGYGKHADGGWEVVFIEPKIRPGETLRVQMTMRTGGSKTRAMTLWHALELAQ
jgi:mono/diheme cytochrome c family protein